MANVKLSASIILRSLPRARFIWILSLLAFAIFNGFDVLLPIYDHELFLRWLAFSRPLVDLVSDHVWTIGYVSQPLQQTGDANSVDAGINFIAIDWAIYLVALASLLLAVAVDFALDARRVSTDIEKRIAALPEKWDNFGSGTRLENIIFIYLLLSVLFTVFILIGLGYDPVRLNRDYAGMILALIYWYGAISHPPSMLLLILLWFYGGRWIGMSRANS